jgi:PTH1 family peptidyl-tRNA hydrolase
MNFLIAGLGNIGEEYRDTRHNIGFDVVDVLARNNNVAFDLNRNAFYAGYKSRGKQVHIIKPTTYMNLSGKAVRYWMQELKVPQERILIVLDDLAIDFGALRLRAKGSDGGHNGLKDIDIMLGNQNYARLRFGIGSNYPKGAQINYVLGKWTAQEAKHLPEHIDRACDAINSFMFEGLGNAMTKYNK